MDSIAWGANIGLTGIWMGLSLIPYEIMLYPTKTFKTVSGVVKLYMNEGESVLSNTLPHMKFTSMWVEDFFCLTCVNVLTTCLACDFFFYDKGTCNCHSLGAHRVKPCSYVITCKTT